MMNVKPWSIAIALFGVAVFAASADTLTPSDSNAGESAKKANRKTDIPKFVVDPFWPKPLANRWVTGEVGGICVDSNDHVFGINRRNVTSLEMTVGKQP